jgi:hypothetical protein
MRMSRHSLGGKELALTAKGYTGFGCETTTPRGGGCDPAHLKR